MIVVGAALIFASLAALLHVYFFALESLLWTKPRTRALFGITAEEADTTKPLAFNQGFYNLFLAVITAVGIVAIASGCRPAGSALVFAGAGSMALAAVVLAASSPEKVRAALVQGTFPLLAVVLLALRLAI